MHLKYFTHFLCLLTSEKTTNLYVHYHALIMSYSIILVFILYDFNAKHRFLRCSTKYYIYSIELSVVI
jgi:hypothetical protein